MNRDPKVSVIVPIYNQEKYLRDCLESIVFQNLEEIEILCVNDGSTDGSFAILSEFDWQDERLRIINQDNQGVGSARNTGLREARGEYVAFIDPDDWYYDFTVLEKLYGYAKANEALVCGGCFTIQHEKHGERAEFHREEARYVFAESRMYTYEEYQFDYGFHRFIYDREFLLSHELFFPPLKRYEDPVWFTRVMHTAGSFFGTTDKVYAYRLGHKEIGWTKEKVCHHVAGITEVARLAVDHGYEHLSALEHGRLILGSAEIAYPYICDKDEDMALLLTSYEEATGRRNVEREILANVVRKRDEAKASAQQALEETRTGAQALRAENGALRREMEQMRGTLADVEANLGRILEELGLRTERVKAFVPKNVLPYPYVHTTVTRDGLTWTDLGDGRLEVNGTAERDTSFTLTPVVKATDFATHHQRYVVTVGAENASSLTWYISGLVVDRDKDESALLRDVVVGEGSGFAQSFEIDTAGYDYFGRLYIVIKAGCTLDHIVFSPMIVPVDRWDGEWEPFEAKSK